MLLYFTFYEEDVRAAISKMLGIRMNHKKSRTFSSFLIADIHIDRFILPRYTR